MLKQWILPILLALLSAAKAQELTALDGYNETDGSFPFDPILEYRPSFACSLPVQILMTGIVLTLTSVLLVHLLFTAQYHWPLAPVNYALQVSAVCTLLTSLIATLHVVLQAATDESRQWPYMLNYIAVDIPPLQYNTGWTSGELAAWLLMNATTSALIQITHIQFLTLLFPSTLERRLIFVLLGPLAIVAAIMQLVPLNDSADDGQLTSIATAVQNVCNATLSLLFTSSLFIWGFLVNRKQAWRTDGGTAAFGVGAMLLAVGSTTITFIYIPSKEHYAWMPGLMWAVILWQSFLGWWWWVGAGMGVGEVDELLRREEKRRKKRKAKLARRELRKGKADAFLRGVAGAIGYSSRSRGEKRGEQREGSASRSASEGRPSGSDDEGRAGTRLARVPTDESTPASAHTHLSSTSTSSSGTSATASGFFGRVRSHVLVRCVYGWYLLLRHAHLIAAREQAVEHGERIQQVYGHARQPGAAPENPDPARVGWGLGAYGLRQMEMGERERDVEAERGILEVDREERERSMDGEPGRSSEDEREADGVGEKDVGRRRRVSAASTREETMSMPDDNATASANENEKVRTRRRKNRRTREDTDVQGQSEAEGGGQPSSMWYWGPLRRWRLQDSTSYS